MSDVRLGVIGCGAMAQYHMSDMHHVPHLRFTCAADPLEQARDTVAKRHGVRVFETGEDLIESGEADAVLIATPHRLHPVYVIAAMEHGLHVLTEKPLAVSVSDADRAIEAAARRPDLTFAIMHQMRLTPTWQFVKNFVDRGELGQPLRASWTITRWYRSQSYYDSAAWRGTWAGEGGGVLLNQCPHQLDLLTWIMGSPSQVHATVSLGKYHDIEVEDEAAAILRFPNGCIGTFVTSTIEWPGVDRLELVGDRARLIVEGNGPVRICRSDTSLLDFARTSSVPQGGPDYSESEVRPDGMEADPRRGLVTNFIAAVRGHEPLVSPGEQGIRSLELSNAILLSGMQQRPVELPLDRAAYDRLMEQLTAPKYAGIPQ